MIFQHDITHLPKTRTRIVELLADLQMSPQLSGCAHPNGTAFVCASHPAVIRCGDCALEHVGRHEDDAAFYCAECGALGDETPCLSLEEAPPLTVLRPNGERIDHDGLLTIVGLAFCRSCWGEPQ